jgi:hypothetical protein
MAMVAYDPNSPESGFLQGWLTHDRFLLRGAFGSVYEFLWANPYLPGLSYYHVPLVFYDAQRGRLLLRSSWEEDAVWFGRIEGEMQIFDAGRVTVVPPASQKTMEFGESSIVAGRLPIRFTRQPKHGLTLFFVGLRPQTVLDIEIDDEELREAKTDASGTLKLEFPRGSRPGLRIRETPPRADAATN